MANDQDKMPTTDEQTDISKAQAKQEPLGEKKSGQFEAGEQQPFGEASQGETLAKQRTDIEGATLQSEKGEAESGFVGSEGQQDSSSELVEDEDKESFKSDGE